MKVVQCCLWCFEKIVKYLTRNAYIYVSITGVLIYLILYVWCV